MPLLFVFIKFIKALALFHDGTYDHDQYKGKYQQYQWV